MSVVNDLTEFLLARIADDEQLARAAASWSGGAEWGDAEDPDAGDPDERHIARHDPARVLAECEAKRRIVEEHRPIPCENARHPNGLHCVVCSYEDIPKEWHPCVTVRLLALPYADHPDYRQEWKP